MDGILAGRHRDHSRAMGVCALDIARRVADDDDIGGDDRGRQTASAGRDRAQRARDDCDRARPHQTRRSGSTATGRSGRASPPPPRRSCPSAGPGTCAATSERVEQRGECPAAPLVPAVGSCDFLAQALEIAHRGMRRCRTRRPACACRSQRVGQDARVRAPASATSQTRRGCRRRPRTRGSWPAARRRR